MSKFKAKKFVYFIVAALLLAVSVLCFMDFPQIWDKLHSSIANLSLLDLFEIVAVPIIAFGTAIWGLISLVLVFLD